MQRTCTFLCTSFANLDFTKNNCAPTPNTRIKSLVGDHPLLSIGVHSVAKRRLGIPSSFAEYRRCLPVWLSKWLSNQLLLHCLGFTPTDLQPPVSSIPLGKTPIGRLSSLGGYCAVNPPSITSSLPVINDDSSEAKNRTP